MSELCTWLHKQLRELPPIQFPFQLGQLPRNGIYFFYEEGEIWGHGDDHPRIVRIGTHKDGNFRSRIREHFLLDETRMNFDATRPAPHDRSIFRKNLGRALLNKANDEYLRIWDIDFTPRRNRAEFGALRDIQKEQQIESKITQILSEKFSFKFIIIENQMNRMGAGGLESSLIGTVARCPLCKPSNDWLGNHSSKSQIKNSGLWQVQHLKAPKITTNDMDIIIQAIKRRNE